VSVYATLQDYATFTDEAPAPASLNVLLARASGQVDEAVIAATYDVDADGLPTDEKVAGALRDATCAQVVYWDEIGDTNATGAAERWQSASIGSASYSRANSQQAGRSQARLDLAPAAVTILRNAGLLPGSPQLIG
jgi:hypothetical protein